MISFIKSPYALICKKSKARFILSIYIFQKGWLSVVCWFWSICSINYHIHSLSFQIKFRPKKKKMLINDKTVLVQFNNKKNLKKKNAYTKNGMQLFQIIRIGDVISHLIDWVIHILSPCIFHILCEHDGISSAQTTNLVFI